jgi:glycosyltransferase involved in cell wall biosynthesis
MKSAQEVIIVTIMREKGGSGLQTYINNLADHINTTGGTASILTPFDYYRVPTTMVFGFRKLVDYISDELSTWWYEYWHYYFLKLALAKKLQQNKSAGIGSIIYAQCPLSAKAALESRLQGQKVFMVVHFNVSQADEWADKKKIKRDGWWFNAIRKREREVLPELNGVVFVSEFMKRKIEEYLGPQFPVNAACIPCFTSKPNSANTQQTQYDLITIGTLEARKNHAYILRVLSIAKSRGHLFTLTLVGDGPERNALERLAKEWGIESQVRFLGSQPKASAFILGHKVYVHGALIENLPISLLEGQACGLPIIAPAVGGIPEIITDGQEGFFWPLNDPEIGTDRLIQIMTNTDLYQKMSMAAAVKFQQKFETEAVVERLKAFWNN